MRTHDRDREPEGDRDFLAQGADTFHVTPPPFSQDLREKAIESARLKVRLARL